MFASAPIYPLVPVLCTECTLDFIMMKSPSWNSLYYVIFKFHHIHRIHLSQQKQTKRVCLLFGRVNECVPTLAIIWLKGVYGRCYYSITQFLCACSLHSLVFYSVGILAFWMCHAAWKQLQGKIAKALNGAEGRVYMWCSFLYFFFISVPLSIALLPYNVNAQLWNSQFHRLTRIQKKTN